MPLLTPIFGSGPIIALVQKSGSIIAGKAEKAFGGFVAGIKGYNANSNNIYALGKDQQVVLEYLAKRFGYSLDDLASKIAPYVSSKMEMPAHAREAAKAKAANNSFKYVKVFGRLMLVVGVAADVYEVYHAKNKAKTISKKAGGWAGAGAASSLAAKAGSPLLGGGLAGGAAYLLVVGGAGVLGFMGGEKLTETVYEWKFESGRYGNARNFNRAYLRS